MPTSTSLTSLLDRLTAAGLLVRTYGRIGHDAGFAHLTADSRAVRSGSLFVAIRGGQADGHRFLDKAVKHGALAILCEAVPPDVADLTKGGPHGGTVLVQVASTRAALAEAAALHAGDPSARLAVVGVTGTNGKTTTTFLLHHLFEALGEPTGLVGTIETRVGNERRPATHTTPDPLALQALLRRMAEARCTRVAMEVSSHALDQDRVRGVRFAAGVFTNLTRDHLDYHPGFEAYGAVKKRLFDGLGEGTVAVTNVDDGWGERMVADTAARVVRYGQGASADVRFAVVENALAGLVLDLGGARRRYRLVGGFNAYNLAAAYATAVALGVPSEAALAALATAPTVPGRFEQFVDGEGRAVVVDYAHTPDALENVLRTMRATMATPESGHRAGRLWVVFGCGGDRDPGKRRVMGSLAEKLADCVVVTSDNPRTEDPEAILAEIRRGMDDPTRAAWIVDRRAALAYAAAHAAPGDAVLVAGKGHEPYQVVGTETVHFDDREEVQALFGARPPGA